MKRPWFNILLLTLLSCSENEDNGETDMLEINAILPSTILLKEIPSGTFIMGGSTVQNDAPEVSITMTSFKISEKEVKMMHQRLALQ